MISESSRKRVLPVIPLHTTHGCIRPPNCDAARLITNLPPFLGASWQGACHQGNIRKLLSSFHDVIALQSVKPLFDAQKKAFRSPHHPVLGSAICNLSPRLSSVFS